MYSRKDVLTFLQKNYGWITALITGLTVIISFILRFIKYLYSSFYFNYYGLTYELFDSSELTFIYNFGVSILLLFCSVSLLYCIIQLLNIRKMKIKIRTILLNIILIVFGNIILTVATNTSFLFYQVVFKVLLLIASEFITIYIYSKIIKKTYSDETNKSYLFNNLKILPFYLVFLVVIFILNYGYGVVSNKTYRIINNNKVIIYTSTDYYLLLDADINGNNLIMYKGTQSKIDNKNIESKLIDFDSVKVK